MYLQSDSKPEGDRPATIIIYLNDVDGGETVYARGKCESLKDCCKPESGALRVPPKAGSAVLHYSVTQEPKFEGKMARYGSCPVRSGEKWIIQRMFRNVPTLKLRHGLDPLH